MSRNTGRNCTTGTSRRMFLAQMPHLKTEVDTITFRYPGSAGEYFGNFSSTNGRYKVSLRCVNERDRQLRNASNPTPNQTHFTTHVLTIRWNKISRKFLRIKAYEEDTMKVILNKKTFRSLTFSINISYAASENKAVVYVIKIITYTNIAELNNKQLLQQFEKSDDSEQAMEKFELLASDIKDLLLNSALSDVVITDGENEIKVHKLILSARSPVFNKMFLHPTKENIEGLITITDIPFKTLKVLTDYMYSGIVKIDDMKMARDLYIAADKYDIQSLKKICLRKLESMNINHVLDNLILAELYDETTLKEAAFNFVAENYSKVKILDKWSEFKKEHKALSVELLSYVLEK